ncbi:hypothetical protein A9239_08710 [Methanosarcina sp. A14]|nr:hypothetical protein A9239_08710 [Methanosarcina sp. A14]
MKKERIESRNLSLTLLFFFWLFRFSSFFLITSGAQRVTNIPDFSHAVLQLLLSSSQNLIMSMVFKFWMIYQVPIMKMVKAFY